MRTILFASTVLIAAWMSPSFAARIPSAPPQASFSQPAISPAAANIAIVAGSKKVLTADDYGRWRTIADEHISSDGKWVTWAYRHVNTLAKDNKPELHILNLETMKDVTVANASNGEFSPDGRWIAYEVNTPRPRSSGGSGALPAPGGASAAGQADATEQAGGHDSTLHRIELRELTTGTTRVWHDMQSATFAENSYYLLLQARPSADRTQRSRAGGPAGFGRRRSADSGDQPPSRGSDAILVDLTTGRGQLIGSVADAAFNRAGNLFAYTVDASVRDGNGLYVINLATGATHALDSGDRIYDRLAWNDTGTGVAVLKGMEVPKMRERNNVLVIIPNVRAAVADPKLAPRTLDTSAAGFPAGWVTSDRAPLTWSEDNARVFFGAMPQTPTADLATIRSTDSTADVDVWRTADRYIQSEQMIRAKQDRNFTYREAFNVARATYIPLSDPTMRDLQISVNGRWGVGRDARPYISDWKPAAADFYRVDLATGQRKLMFKDQLTQGAWFGIAPDSRHAVYWKNGKFQAYDLEAGTTTTLGAGAPSFVNTDFDHPGPKPPWGVAGYAADGKSVIVETKYDLWTLPFNGGQARDITAGFGVKNQMILRLVRLAPIGPMASLRKRTGQEWDLSKPVTLSAFGDLTKKAGFYTLSKGVLSRVVYDDAFYSIPVKATHADRYLFTRETFTKSPDLRVSGSDFAKAKRITDSNPQQAEYRWGHSRLFNFTDRFGHKLQGLLWIPDDYKPGEKRPMLVTFYEKNSQLLNRYPMPALLVEMGGRPAIEEVSRGYIAMDPDIYYNTGSSHNDQLDCVEAATRKVIAMGYADPKRIGLHGHSYGGEGAAYIATRSRLFAAVGEGAGVTDLYTDFNQEWGWSYQNQHGSGENGNQYYIYGQGRWGFSPWQKPDVYHDESALTHVPEVREPILIMAGTADPTVNFIEDLNFYNALRFNGKTAYLLAYLGAGHHVSTFADRKDLTIRFFQFFDHYLMGVPAPKWMTAGVPFLKRDELMNPGLDKPCAWVGDGQMGGNSVLPTGASGRNSGPDRCR